MKHILIVRLAGIGDIATASTLLARVRAEHPEARVTWLCGEGGAPLVRLFGVDEIITVAEERLLAGSLPRRAIELARFWRRMLGRRFDLVLLVHADPRYRALLAPMRAARVHALQREAGRRPHPLPGRFFGDEYVRLLDGDEPTGPVVRRFDVADLRERLTEPSPRPRRAGEGPLVAVVPGGARNVLRDDPLRRWPPESYVRLVEQLRASGCTVLLLGGPQDEWVRPHFEGLGAEDLIGKLALTETLALLRDCDLAISHDTGPIHLARLVRTPLVALFGPTTPSQVLLEDERTIVLWGGRELACRPCFDGRAFAKCNDNLCVKSITVDQVVAAAATLLRLPLPSPVSL